MGKTTYTFKLPYYFISNILTGALTELWSYVIICYYLLGCGLGWLILNAILVKRVAGAFRVDATIFYATKFG